HDRRFRQRTRQADHAARAPPRHDRGRAQGHQRLRHADPVPRRQHLQRQVRRRRRLGASSQRRRAGASDRGRDGPPRDDRRGAAILCAEGGDAGDRAAEHLAPLARAERGGADDRDAEADRAPNRRCRGPAQPQRGSAFRPYRREVAPMYFDRRLWELTRGMRARIAAAIAIGLAASGFGIARFALLGTLLALVFAGGSAAAIGLVAAAIVLRSALDQARTVIAHRTATRVQDILRGRLYDKIAELGPAWFTGERTGGVMLSVVDGVEQLQTFFGQYVPQLAVAALTPVAIFLFIVWWD